MIQPPELKLNLPVELSNGVMSATDNVWQILSAAKKGDMETVARLETDSPELIYAQYNYTPPIYFAVSEGHTSLVKYLLAKKAHDPSYKIYPFLDSLETIAADRGFIEIESLLRAYSTDPEAGKIYHGDNGRIHFQRTKEEEAFEKAVYEEDLHRTGAILNAHPEYAKNETYFWAEGILLFAAKHNNRKMTDLLMNYGAKVPDIVKWAQFYYFEHDNAAAYMLKKGMNPNIMSWLHVSILHDMAQKGIIAKAELLLQYGADINAIDEVYNSTPLGLAVRWGHGEMVEYLLKNQADPNLSGASWSTPLAWARKKNHQVIERILMDNGAK